MDKPTYLILLIVGLSIVVGIESYLLLFPKPMKESVTYYTHESLTPQPFRDTSIYVIGKLGIGTSKLPHPKVIVEDTNQYVLKSSYDSLNAEHEYAIEKVDTTIQFDTTASLRVQYSPLNHVLGLGLQMMPIRRDTVFRVDSVFMPTSTNYYKEAVKVGLWFIVLRSLEQLIFKK